jgi:hypothetical protein
MTGGTIDDCSCMLHRRHAFVSALITLEIYWHVFPIITLLEKEGRIQTTPDRDAGIPTGIQKENTPPGVFPPTYFCFVNYQFHVWSLVRSHVKQIVSDCTISEISLLWQFAIRISACETIHWDSRLYKI